MTTVSRRNLLATFAAPVLLREAKAAGHVVGFNSGTYGTKSMKTADALRAMAEMGYDGVELAMMPGWPTDPAAMTSDTRRSLQKLLDDTGLVLPALLEALPLTGTRENRAHNLDRLKLAIDLGHFLAPHNPPVVETIVGGKSEQWDQVKVRIADELPHGRNSVRSAAVLSASSRTQGKRSTRRNPRSGCLSRWGVGGCALSTTTVTFM